MIFSPFSLFMGKGNSDGHHTVREDKQILVNLSFEVGAGIN